MFIACGDDSSSASSGDSESSSSVVAESSSSDWAHESVGEYICLSDKDSTTIHRYAFEGPDSAMEVARNIYPKLNEDVEKVCEEAKDEKTKEQEVTCDSIVKVINPPQTMNFDSLKSLMGKECKAGSVKNTVDLVNPNKAPENSTSEDVEDLWEAIKKNPLCFITMTCS